LHIAEVQVFDASGLNWAEGMNGEGAVASQSSVFQSEGSSCSASYANDGSTANDAETICEGLAWTNQEQDPWWMVNINDLVAITRIVIWNRVTQAMSQLSNAKVTLYDASQNAISEAFLGSTAEVGMIELSIADFDAVTEEPSRQPSEFPSSTPSSIPSSTPSSMPSSTPSFSSMPSSAPSSTPSSAPSSMPRIVKFVRISLSGDSTLQLAEVQAFDDNGINRALSFGTDMPVATQSSTYLWSGVTPCPATIANDGVTQSDTSSTCDGVSHTNTESNPWWMVEFDDLYPIEEVILWNRMTCCSGDLSNAKVELLDENSNLISQIADIGGTTGLQNISLGIASFVAPTATKSPTSSPTLGPYMAVDSGMCADVSSYMFDGLYYNCSYPATVDLSTCISKCDQLSSLNYWGNHNGISLEQKVEMETERCICHYDSNQTIPVYDPTCWAKLTSYTSPNIGSGEVVSTYASSSTTCYKRRCYPFCESSQPSTSSQPSSQPSLEPSNSPSESPTAQECLPQARKVRIEAKPGNYLQLFLVQVFSSTTGSCLAVGKTATQSSTYDDSTPASAAIGGSDKYSFSLTDRSDQNAWWEVDLAEETSIKSIYIGQHMCKDAPDPIECFCHLSESSILLMDSSDLIISNYTFDKICARRHVIEFEETSEYCQTATEAPTKSPTAGPTTMPSTSPTQSLLQWSQVGTDIDGEATGDFSGNSISLSGDGLTVAIGGRYNDGSATDSGHVRVYTWNNTNWIQLGQDIDGEAQDDHFGWSVSLSSDGYTVAVGAPFSDGNGASAGHVRVLSFNETSWNQVGQDIIGEAFADESGRSVSLSSDGSTVAIGATKNSGNGAMSGHVRIYSWVGGVWAQVGGDIDGQASNDQSGFSISLSSDGLTVAIGSPDNNANGTSSGQVRVFTWSGTDWSQIGSDLNGEAAADYFGYSVSISSDGTTVAAGAYGNDGNGSDSGHVRVYKWNTTAWDQVGVDIDGEYASDLSGRSVSISSDGTTVAIGAIQNDGNGDSSGHVRVFTWDEVSWTQLSEDINGEAISDYSGESVSLSSDGNTVAIGAPYNDANGSQSGHVRVYSLPTRGPTTSPSNSPTAPAPPTPKPTTQPTQNALFV